MPEIDYATTFLISYAKCAGFANPTVYVPPVYGELSDQDIDLLTPHFLQSVPRGPVLEAFGDRIGHAAAYGFMIDLDMDPMVKVRLDPMWRTIINLLLKMMVNNGSLKWEEVDDNINGTLTCFYVQNDSASGEDDDSESEGIYDDDGSEGECDP